MVLDLHGDAAGGVDRVQLQGAVGQVVGVADIGERLVAFHRLDRLRIAPVGRAGVLRAQRVVDREVEPLVLRVHVALDVELRGPAERAVMLRVAVGDGRITLVHLPEELGDIDHVLVGRLVGELEAVAVVGLEVLGQLLEQVLPVEGAGDRAVIGEGADRAALVVDAAGIQIILEPDVAAVALRVERQGVVDRELVEVGVEVREGRADRLVLHVVEVIVGLAATKVDTDLLLHGRQAVGQDLHLDPGEIVERLNVVADREGRRRVLGHEDELRALVLAPLGFIGRIGVDRAARDHRVHANRDRARTECGCDTASELEEFAAADRLVQRLLGHREHAVLLLGECRAMASCGRDGVRFAARAGGPRAVSLRRRDAN